VSAPAASRVDGRLVLGSLVFGIGWGLAGICPGPAVVLLGAGYGKVVTFLLAMLVGMALFEAAERMSGRRAAGLRQPEETRGV
jgi:uncharacterized membrane protein YedE/YeeE